PRARWLPSIPHPLACPQDPEFRLPPAPWCTCPEKGVNPTPRVPASGLIIHPSSFSLKSPVALCALAFVCGSILFGDFGGNFTLFQPRFNGFAHPPHPVTTPRLQHPFHTSFLGVPHNIHDGVCIYQQFARHHNPAISPRQDTLTNN